jgi:peptidoglycan/LPS O-acetylase OafA/YrhL
VSSGHSRREEIQALRAIAVLLVVLFHLWPDLVPGGFVGVDVFFAISGFLITGMLVREVQRTGTVPLAAFWARRARRLLPAPLLVILACAVATAAIVPLTAWDRFFAEFRASTAYVENWHLAATSVDYFAANDAPSPVRHFWSLSAEEQFYLVWPLLMLGGVLLARWRGGVRMRAVGFVLAVTTLLSLVCSVVVTASDPSIAYYATPTRAWEFGAGGLLALLSARAVARPVVGGVLSWLGLAAIFVAALAFTERLAFPGLVAVLPVGGALAVMAAGMPACRWAPTAVLRLPPMQFLGDVSYSVYLWHWPLLIFAPYALGHAVGDGTALAIFGLTIVAAWLTKVLVEDPVRGASALIRRPPRLTLVAAAAATACVIGVTVAGSDRVQAQAARDAQVTRQTLAHRPHCFGAAARDPSHPCHNARLRSIVVPTPVEAEKMPNAPCRITERDRRLRVCTFGLANARTTVAVVGDSHASHWRPALDVVAKARRWRGLSITRTGCAFSLATPDVVPRARTHCNQWKRQVLDWFHRHPEVGTVVVAAHAGAGVVAPPDRDQFTVKRQGYAAAWRALPSSVRRIVVIRDTPRMRGGTLDCVQEAMDDGEGAVGDECAVPRRLALQPDPQVAAAQTSPGAKRVSVVDLTRLLCDARTCPAVVGGALAFKDEDHLTPVFAATLAPYLRRGIDRALR